MLVEWRKHAQFRNLYGVSHLCWRHSLSEEWLIDNDKVIFALVSSAVNEILYSSLIGYTELCKSYSVCISAMSTTTHSSVSDTHYMTVHCIT